MEAVYHDIVHVSYSAYWETIPCTLYWTSGLAHNCVVISGFFVVFCGFVEPDVFYSHKQSPEIIQNDKFVFLHNTSSTT